MGRRRQRPKGRQRAVDNDPGRDELEALVDILEKAPDEAAQDEGDDDPR